MLRKRVIPCLLIQNQGLVKTKQFKRPKYVGDPINALKIFNDKQADELIVLSIDKNRYEKGPDFNLISELTTECFMPLAYGGGISKLEHIEKLFRLGVEKVVLGAMCFDKPKLLREAISIFGSQSIVGVIDLKKKFLSNLYSVYIYGGNKRIALTPLDYLTYLEDLGLGEVLVQFIDKEGTRMGYDYEMLQRLSINTKLPLLALGGAGKLTDFKLAFDCGVSGVVAGTYFVMLPPHDAVLINYLSNEDILNL
jgi:cyclase